MTAHPHEGPMPSGTAPGTGRRTKPLSVRLRRWYDTTGFWLLLLMPVIITLAVFQFYPLLETLRMGWTDASARNPDPSFVGAENFGTLVSDDPHFWTIVRNSFIWVFASVILQLVVGTAAALVLNANIRFRSIWRGLLMVPWVTPTIVVGVIWRWIFEGSESGLVNHVLSVTGAVEDPIVFLASDFWVWPVLLFASTWKGVPFVTLLVLAALQGVSKELHESAAVDGAGRIARFRHVTIPAIRPTLFTTGMISLVTTWFKFELIWALTNGGPGFATSILPTYVYTWAFNRLDYGMAGATATLALIIILVVAALYALLFREKET